MDGNYLTRRGYTIRKSSLSPRRDQKLRKELTVQPFEKQRYLMEKFGKLPPKYKVFLESANKFYVPKYYGIEHFGEAEDKVGDAGDNIAIDFKGKLRPEQTEIMNNFMPLLKKNKGGILNLRTGGGKTCLALYIISMLKKKTLIIVHKEFLLNQWIKQIEIFLPDAKIGLIQGPTIKVEKCDIVLGMLQSISQRNYDEKAFQSFGLNIIDETHHIASNVFSRALPKIFTQFNIGLSATVKRKDEMEKILEWHIGPVFKPDEGEDCIGEVKVFMVTFVDAEYQQTYLNSRGYANLPIMINKMVESPYREKTILELILHFNILGRKILVLSERRKQLDNLSKKLNEMNIHNGLYYGGLKQEVLENSNKMPVVLATIQAVSEGYDNPLLNTLIFATPKSDIIQSVGRILRQEPDKRKFIPIIVDIVDDTVAMKKKSELRKKYYKKCKFDLTYYKNISDLTLVT
jgi:superfamily II DNA or RNA helicase